ncbi:unnamed protein product, partial [Nesidiocoris tenuis]
MWLANLKTVQFHHFDVFSRYKRHQEPPDQPKVKIVEPKFSPKLETFSEHPATTTNSTLSSVTSTLAVSALKQFIATDT